MDRQPHHRETISRAVRQLYGACFQGVGMTSEEQSTPPAIYLKVLCLTPAHIYENPPEYSCLFL